MPGSADSAKACLRLEHCRKVQSAGRSRCSCHRVHSAEEDRDKRTASGGSGKFVSPRSPPVSDHRACLSLAHCSKTQGGQRCSCHRGCKASGHKASPPSRSTGSLARCIGLEHCSKVQGGQRCSCYRGRSAVQGGAAGDDDAQGEEREPCLPPPPSPPFIPSDSDVSAHKTASGEDEVDGTRSEDPFIRWLTTIDGTISVIHPDDRPDVSVSQSRCLLCDVSFEQLHFALDHVHEKHPTHRPVNCFPTFISKRKVERVSSGGGGKRRKPS